MHEEHLTIMQSAETDTLVGARGEPVRPVQRTRPQLFTVEVAAAQMQQRRAHPILPRLGIVFDESD